MVRPGRGQFAVVALLAVAALTGVVLGKGGESGFLPEKATTCWTCHASWVPPLRSAYNIIPPPRVDVTPGTPFEYTVQIENPWLARLTYIAPTVDLSGAPSLGFLSAAEPIENLQFDGVIDIDLTQLAEPQTGFVVVNIPEGSTSMALRMVPSNTGATGPDLAMRIYPGRNEPNGTAVEVNDQGAGGTELFEIKEAAGFAELGYGNWTVEAALLLVDAEGGSVFLPASQTVPFTVFLSSRSDTVGETALTLARRIDVEAGLSTFFTWRMQASAPPGENERVRLVVNATAFFLHLDKANDNYGNFTKTRDDILYTLDGGQAVLKPQTVIRNAGPSIRNGPSMDTISEAVGYASSFLLISSIWSGGMFGKASRRHLNGWFGSAKRRVAFHNFLSYGLTLAAAVHIVLFIIEQAYYWTLGLIWGSIAMLAMVGLGLTGALQVPMIRKWNYGTWRWTHYAMAVAAILFTLVHMWLDGTNFAFARNWTGWADPLDPRNIS